LLETHAADGTLLSVRIYASRINEQELEGVKKQARRFSISYCLVVKSDQEFRETFYDKKGRKTDENVTYLSTDRFGDEEYIKNGQVKISSRQIRSKSGGVLFEEIYDKAGSLIDCIDIRHIPIRRKYFSPSFDIETSYRLGFDNWNGLLKVINNRGRVELALPHVMSYFNQTVLNRVQETIDILKKSKLTVATVHSVQAPLSQDSFLDWGEMVLQIADAVRARSVTFHPNKSKQDTSTESAQKKALAMIEKLQKRHQAIIAIETFDDEHRLFRPEDLVKYNLPIVLDVAHLKDEDALNLIRNHSKLIRTIHLSAKGKDNHHLPFDRFCLDILEEAIHAEWKGDVVLEYLPQYKKFIDSDLISLNTFLREFNGT
ncbi:sugar phosphate isomerase/epimerase family protein, partial [Candidatus Margulisiibacteriota bacterium]